ncbi:MAG TPA: hypothetical protein DHI91_00890 [Candidatus Portnoybacteria bacterium]|uniref:Uncharacterized protein n=1 Tax=Candidatus Portnoybacteria bacterium CG02_land_8_20_14_3_00_45_8 TaxID=1974807 RepID=A0A2M7D6F7_9BACT|nr:MAG: hypothetical protein COS30_01145 [Candidatus Portnoybacteria bacterium CG02_land_8_20_14_3_00_45_8]HCX27680.1 hypothetical protein [Candidatus Portnoybacteria bacterium]
MSKIQELLLGKTDQIHYEEIIKNYPWIIKKGQNCILSPDSDGLLCGLFMLAYLDWEIKGFYDGKIMLLDKDTPVKDCVFLDMEIFREEIKSVGHHMMQFNKNKKPANWGNFKNCIQANNLRNYDGYHDFRLKYPLATIHLLMGIVGSKIKLTIPKTAICPLLYVDGVFKNLFGYPENCIDWLRYLGADSSINKLNSIFFNEHYSVYDLMLALKDFFVKIDEIGDGRSRNDKIKISDSKGEIVNLVEKDNICEINKEESKKADIFLEILSKLTTWKYKKNDWQWSDFKLYCFSKDNIKPSNRNFEEMIKNNPLSWAMTSGLAIEYTLEKQENNLLE